MLFIYDDCYKITNTYFGESKGKPMIEVQIPKTMIENVRKYGDPQTIIPFIIKTHLLALKKKIEESPEFSDRKLEATFWTSGLYH